MALKKIGEGRRGNFNTAEIKTVLCCKDGRKPILLFTLGCLGKPHKDHLSGEVKWCSPAQPLSGTMDKHTKIGNGENSPGRDFEVKGQGMEP